METFKSVNEFSSQETEAVVLGCMLEYKAHLNAGCENLEESCFINDSHLTIFKTLKDFYLKDRNADVYLVAEELKNRNRLDSIGGISFLMDLSQSAITGSNFYDYVAILQDNALKRKMSSSLKEMMFLLQENKLPIQETIDKAQSLIFQLGQLSNTKEALTIKEILEQEKFIEKLGLRVEEYRTHSKKEKNTTGISTGFIDLDKLIDGFENSNLIILAARPSMGKTALALNIADSVASSGIPVGIFSIEMRKNQLVDRIICFKSKVGAEEIKQGSVNDKNYQSVIDATNELKSSNKIIIDDDDMVNINQLRSKARRMKAKHNIGLLIIDYLQFIKGASSKPESRQLEVSEISRMLKSLAKELNIPVVCLSSLSREVEKRVGHCPMMSDLRESGSIESDADVVIFLLRREYYDPNDKPGQAELIIAKNRHGPIGKVPLTYMKEYALFTNYTPLRVSDYQFSNAETEEAFSYFNPE